MFNFFSKDVTIYSTPRHRDWRKVRAEHLLSQPYCMVCGSTKGLQVHHIKPFHLYPELELEPNNLLTLGTKCSSGNHHYLFGHFENWHSFNPDVAVHAYQFISGIEIGNMNG